MEKRVVVAAGRNVHSSHARPMRAPLPAPTPGRPVAARVTPRMNASSLHLAHRHPSKDRRRRPGAAGVVAAAATRSPAPQPPQLPHQVLGIPPTATPAEARAAWVALIRQAHPDVVAGPDVDDEAATARAAELNAAYEAFRQGAVDPLPAPATAWPPSSEPPNVPFVDPFAVGVDPFAWRELQALARGQDGAGDDASFPEARLAAARLRVPPGGVAWLTPAQAAEAEAVLAGMEGFAYNPDFASAVLADVLGRAAAVNGGGRPPAW